MKKKLILLVTTICVIGLVGCGGGKKIGKEAKTTTNSSEVLEEEKITSNLENDVEESSEKNENKVSDSKNNVSKESEELEEKGPEFKVVNFGDVITTDFVEMTIESASQAQEIFPTDTSGVYSYMSDKEEETYFYITGNIKNIGGDSYSVEEVTAELCFDNKYNYTAYILADDGGDDFYGDYVKPFGSVKYYLYASIPDELINSYTSCVVRFAFHDDFEHDFSSNFEKYENLYEITITK